MMLMTEEPKKILKNEGNISVRVVEEPLHIRAAHLERTVRCVFWQQLWTRPTTRQCRLLALHCAAAPPSSGGTEASI